MYTLLTKEIADVDQALFRKIGYIDSQVRAFPATDQTIALKGVASHHADCRSDVQNTLIFTLEPEPGYIQWDEALEPGLVYGYEKQLYVELKYAYPMGLLNLNAYFLLHIEDCDYAIESDEGGWDVISFDLITQSYMRPVKD